MDIYVTSIYSVFTTNVSVKLGDNGVGKKYMYGTNENAKFESLFSLVSKLKREYKRNRFCHILK